MVCARGDRGRWVTPPTGTRSMAARLVANAEVHLCCYRLFTRPFASWSGRTLTGERFCKLRCFEIRFFSVGVVD